MVLIRCMSEKQSTGSFYNDFSEPIIIEPNSKICLVNASLSLNSESITVTSGNNTLKYQIKSSGPEYTVTVPVGNYTQTGLVQALSTALNTARPYPSDNEGFRWKVGVAASTGRLSLNFGRSGIEALQDNLTKLDATTNVGYLTALGSVSDTTFSRFAYSDAVVTSGGGYIKASILNMTDANNVHGIFGLLSSKPDGDAVTLDSTNYKIGIRVSVTAELFIIVDGVETKSSVLIGATDGLVIAFNAGKVEFYKDTAGTLASLGAAVALPYDVLGHHAALSLRSTGAKGKVEYFPDPFGGSKLLGSDIVVPELPLPTVLHESVGLTNVVRSVVTLALTEESKLLLGFDFTTKSMNAVSGAFVAAAGLPSSNVPSNILVEVPTFFTMRSYDSKTRKRRPMISVIPSLIQNANRLVYDSQYPVWIPLDNAYPQSISRLDVRLLDSDTDEEIRLEAPGATLTILISKD